MKAKFWQTKEFKDLEAEWYGKLEEQEFTDIEKTVNGKNLLKQNASNCYGRASITTIDAKQRYYELLQQAFEEEIEFKDCIERLVMERKSCGIRIKNICLELEEMGKKRYRGTVRKIINKYEAKWGVKKK